MQGGHHGGRQREGFEAVVLNESAGGLGGFQRQQGVEAGAEADFEDAQGPGRFGGSGQQRQQPVPDEDVRRLLPRPVPRVVLLVQGRHEKRGRAIGRHAHLYLWLVIQWLLAVHL